VYFTQGENKEMRITVSHSTMLLFLVVDWHWEYGV